MNSKTIKNYFGYHTPSFLVKDLYKVNQNKSEKIANQINDLLIEFFLKNYTTSMMEKLVLDSFIKKAKSIISLNK